MDCYICGREAVDRCYTCGQLFCQDHGERDCTRCRTAVVSGDPRPDRITATPVSRGRRPGWWRPQAAEDYEPPACYYCKGIARQVCRNCLNLYCPEHAGGHDLCASCDRSSYMGLVILVGIVLFLAALIGSGYLLHWLR